MINVFEIINDVVKEYKTLIDDYIISNAISNPRQIWWKIRPHMDFGTIEFRVCDVQRSLRNVEMLAAICQALVYQSSKDLDNDCLTEYFNMEYLNDALWKAASLGVDGYIINPMTEKKESMRDYINRMLEYVDSSLVYFDNAKIKKTSSDLSPLPSPT